VELTPAKEEEGRGAWKQEVGYLLSSLSDRLKLKADSPLLP
jgi:hypothetical protein